MNRHGRHKCKTRKRFFATELDAKIALSSRRAAGGDEKRYYKCNLCPGYHLSSQDQRTERIDPHGVDLRNASR